MRTFKLLFTILFISLVFVVGANAQECPQDKVCISREAAIKAVENADKVIALEADIKAKETAIAQFRDELNKIRIEFASVSGENTALKQYAVSDRAIIDLLLKSVKKKCMPFSVCF
jgi:hypothetical protein